MAIGRLGVLLCWSLGFSASVGAQEWRVGSLQDTALAVPFQKIVSEAYSRVGLTPRFEPLPLLRSEALLRSGELDAELLRSEVGANQIPQALRVGVPLRAIEYYVLRRPPCAARVEGEELTRLRISLPRGSNALESSLPPGTRVPAADPREALRYVHGGMADLAIIPATPVMRAAAEREGLCAVSTPLAVVPLFHLVHNRHAHLMPRLEAAFSELERNGFMARVWREAEREFPGWQLTKPTPAASAPSR